jgi:hypothetical protein
MINYPVEITDPIYRPKQHLNFFEKGWMKIIKDPRDLPFVKLLVSIHLSVVPGAIILFTPLLQGAWWWVLAVPYFYLSQFYFKGSFGLMIHCIAHRKIWKKKFDWLQKYVYWIVCPLFGHLGESYHSHHIGMHHIGGNMPEDASSTMGYQRDSLKDFIRYWLNFMFLGFVQTFQFLFRRKMPRFYIPLTWSEVGYFFFCMVMLFVNFKATMAVFVVPFLFARLVMMLGNWAQHSFVDPDHPDDELASTVICINTKYNHKCWNDGYHAFHHLRQAAHYTEYPLMFEKHLDELVEKKALVFHGIHFLHIFVWLMTKRYDRLANHVVNINGCFKSEEDVISLLKRRTRKFDLKNFGKKPVNQRVEDLVAA